VTAAPERTVRMPGVTPTADTAVPGDVLPTERAAAQETALRALGVTRRFGEVTAVDSVDLEVLPGELVSVLGPSGCGKTTLLRLIAGFERPDAGGIEISGRAVSGPRRMVPPERRHIGVVFQEPALFPHLDVGGNIGFGVAKPERPARVAELIGLVGLAGLHRRMPYELSGGQQQRVAIARALASRPALMLLDEPFSALDATLRADLRLEVREILRRAGATCILVTHDQAEALQISDRVAVMRAGQIEQVATPDELYLRPATRFVARFVGEANLIAGELHGTEVHTPLGRFTAAPGYGVHGTRAEVLLRPEQLHMLPIERDATPESDSVVLRVVRRVFQGSAVHHVLRSADGLELAAATSPASAVPVDAEVFVDAQTRVVPVYSREGD
jgi:iron(III) transport system ATP-binding protein